MHISFIIELKLLQKREGIVSRPEVCFPFSSDIKLSGKWLNIKHSVRGKHNVLKAVMETGNHGRSPD